MSCTLAHYKIFSAESKPASEDEGMKSLKVLMLNSLLKVSDQCQCRGQPPVLAPDLRQSRLQCHYRDLSPTEITLAPNNNRNTS